MKINAWLKRYSFALLTLSLFLLALAPRLIYFQGFVLGDDTMELATAMEIKNGRIDLENHLHRRFGVWIFNVLVFYLLGVSEFSFFLPTMLFTASTAVIAYLLFKALGYSTLISFLSGLVMATAPFEVFIGTLRANDVYLGWVLALGIWVMVALKQRPVAQGLTIAVLFWFGFYVKLWIVFILPVLGIYWLKQGIVHRQWKPLISCVALSLVLHGLTCLFWKQTIGFYLPFLHSHAATYPTPPEALWTEWWRYPNFFLHGTFLKTTLFGSIPWLYLGLLGLKTVCSVFKTKMGRLDSFDWWLVALFWSFFLLINFFPNSFKFDAYYSMPRIFRYLYPLSFVITLHVCKMLVDLLRELPWPPHYNTRLMVFLMVALSGWNLVQVREATFPGVNYRQNLHAMLKVIQAEPPPVLVTEAFFYHFLNATYFKEYHIDSIVKTAFHTFSAQQHEAWLKQRQDTFESGTLLLTGLGSYVYIAPYYNGFRLRHFRGNLDPRWQLKHEFGLLSWLPTPEKARLWEWSGKAKPSPQQSEALQASKQLTDEQLFEKAIAHFDRLEYEQAKLHFAEIIHLHPSSLWSADSYYFHTICAIRQQKWRTAINEFKQFLILNPDTYWKAGVLYHLGIAHEYLHMDNQAIDYFKQVLKEHADDKPLVKLSKEHLQELRGKLSLLPWIRSWF